MTRSKKLFIAVAILAAGYGVASLLGAPAAMLLSSKERPAEPAIAASSNSPAPLSPTKHAPGELRLVPDARPIEVPTPEAALQPPEPAPDSSAGAWALADDTTAPTDSPPEPPWFSTFEMNTSTAPRAKLRNEAPRALFSEPRGNAPATAKAPVEPVALPPTNGDHHLQKHPRLAASAVVPADYARDTGMREGAETTIASSKTGPPAVQPANSPSNAPAPAPLETHQTPRSHIIVDGDSLAKLAGRYLDDPHRANEIYEVNRHVLSDPELLPIGAQLTIPPRTSSHSNPGSLPQSSLPGSLAVHAAARGQLVPVRPVPALPQIMPRAQLARPLPAP